VTSVGGSSVPEALDIIALPAELLARFSRDDSSASFTRDEWTAGLKTIQKQNPEQAGSSPNSTYRDHFSKPPPPLVAFEDVNTRVKIHQYARVKVHQWKADGWVDSGLWQGEREGDYPLAVSLKI
jgi:hypothetical protein